jgi:hypothetical protein
MPTGCVGAATPGDKRHLDDVFIMINGRSWWCLAGSRRTSTPLSLTRRASLLPDSSFQMICSRFGKIPMKAATGKLLLGKAGKHHSAPGWQSAKDRFTE